MNKKLGNFLFFSIIIISLVAIGLVQNYSLGKNLVITRGKIKYCESLSKDPEVFVHFYFREGEDSGQGMSPIFKTNSSLHLHFLDSLLKDRLLPVVFEKGHFGNNRMIFNTEDCAKFKIVLDGKEAVIINTIDSVIANMK